ncbi:MAG TPA: hypothetical protein VH913_21800, partial [Hyphomicrobiaceae bacterium]
MPRHTDAAFPWMGQPCPPMAETAKLEALLKANSANRTASRAEIGPVDACSDAQVLEIIGAGEGDRTLDTQLGKL